MKPREKKPETIYQIIDRNTGKAQGSYSRACCDEFEFNSAEEARSANVHGMFKDKEKFKIAEYRVIYELIDDDCDRDRDEFFGEGPVLNVKPPLDLCEYQIVECNGCGEKIAVYNDSAYHGVENAWCPVCLKKHKLEGNDSAS